MSIIINPQPAKLSLTPTGLIFVFDNIWTPEGTLRYTLWTTMPSDLRPFLGFQPKNPANAPLPRSLTVECDPKMVVKRGQVGEKLERYFGEPAVNSFEFDVYDAGDPSWITSVTFHDANTNYTFVSPVPFPISRAMEERILWKWIKPLETQEVYGMIEFQGFNEKTFSPLAAGQLQNAIEGQDYRWYHPEDTPYLDANNTPTDAERTWNLKFVPMLIAGLGKINATPNLVSNPVNPALNYNASDPAQWTMPFGNVSSGTVNLPYDTMNWLDNGIVRTGTAIQCAVDTLNHNIAGYWCRHVNAHKLLQYMLDASYGAGRWIIDQCDDSPIQFQWGQFTTQFGSGLNESFVIENNMEEGPQWVTVNLASANPMHWFLVPQAALGLYDSLLPAANAPHPRVDGSWALRFKSALEVFHDLCIALGYDAVMTPDSRGNTHIQFLSKLNHNQPFFTTIAPSSATPTAFPESENGIKATAKGTFANARTEMGAFDDWFAMHTGDSPSMSGALAQSRQVNGYTVPASAQNPNEVEQTLVLGGPVSGISFFSPNSGGPPANQQVGWYSMSFEPGSFNSNPPTTDYQLRTENYPTLSPLVAMVGNTEFSGEIAGVGTAYQAGGTNVIFAPCIRAGFTYTFADGTKTFVSCNSMRQLGARFNSLFYVKSAIKYDVVYPTIHRFMGSKTSPVPNEYSWKNAPLRGLIQLFEPADQVYYVKERTLDLDAWTTTHGLMQAVAFNRHFELGDTLNWQDYTEDTGPHGKPPVLPPNPPPTVLQLPGGATPTHGPMLVKATAGPVNFPHAYDNTGYPHVVVNQSGAPISLVYPAGEGTNVTLPANGVFIHMSDGAVYQTLVNMVPATAGVSSFNARTGAVVPTTGDYTFSLIGGTVALGQLPTGIPNANLAHSSVTVTAGTGMSGGGAVALGGAVTLTNNGALSFNGRNGAVVPLANDYSFSQISGTATTAQLPTGIPNANLANSSVTVTAGTGLSGGGPVALGSSVTLNNTGVTGFNSRSGAVSPTTGDYTAAQVTNAVDSTSTYSNPTWLTGLAGSKVTGNITGFAAGIVPVTPPPLSSSSGSPGQVSWDASFFYICISTNTWRRVAISAW